jgi:dGTPase
VQRTAQIQRPQNNVSAALIADYAVRVEDSRGRRHPEPTHPYRNDFQRDRDRVVHARAFRRLEAKTQVFTRRYSDHFRNRLTHTIEVAQISRTIAQQLRLNSDLVEALALVHDLGHPPFGHSGEKALDAAMRQHGLSFDHNLHALRVVEDFELRYASFRGLNLTFEVREGIIKHSRDYDVKDYPELAEYLLDRRPPLEAQLIDLTDEIAYSTADLDDGFEARLLTVEQIADSVDLFARHYGEAKRRFPKVAEKLIFNEALKSIFDSFVGDLITNTAQRVQAAGVHSVEDIRSHSERIAAFSPPVEEERRRLKDFLHENLYYSPALAEEKEDAERITGELFAHWMEEPDDLPRNYREKVAKDKDPLPRVICDYIAGMTDPFIYQQYEKYCGE